MSNYSKTYKYSMSKTNKTNDGDNDESMNVDKLKDNIMNQYKLSGDNNNLTTDDIFRVLDLHFSKEFYAYRHLQHSFDAFIENTIPRFLTETEHIFSEFKIGEQYVKFKFNIDNIKIVPPKLSNNIDPMFPADARHLAFTYSAKITADITQVKETRYINTNDNKTIITNVGHTERNRTIMLVPVMVRSKYCNLNIYKTETRDECKYDPGGYFIINGSEKVIICQDRMIHNSPLVYSKTASNITYNVVQVNSKHPSVKSSIQTISIRIKKDNIMIVKIPFLQEINVMIVFRALGIESDYDIIELCSHDVNDYYMVELINTSLLHCYNDLTDEKIPIRTQEQAIDYLLSKLKVVKRVSDTNQHTKLEQKRLHLMELFKQSLLPHVSSVNISDPFREKCFYLGYMIKKLLSVQLGRASVDNRDSYTNKRVDNVGELLHEILIQQYNNIISECNKQFMGRMSNDLASDKPYNIIHQLKASSFEQGFKAALMLGNWPRRRGVAQMLQRTSYMWFITTLSRIDSPSGSKTSSKLLTPRHVDPSSLPFLCVVQTPESSKIGLIKHLSLLSTITIANDNNNEIVREFINNYPDIIKLHECDINNNMYIIFLNGEPLGVINNKYNVNDDGKDNPVIKFFTEAKFRKITCIFDPEMTSISLDDEHQEIRFWTDSGRFTVPRLRINGDNEIMLKKSDIDNISLDKTKTNKITSWELLCKNYPYPIEFIDSEEQPYVMVAENRNILNTERKKILDSSSIQFTGNENDIINRYDNNFFIRYDCVEFHPSVLLGELATNIPFCNRNEAPRNFFQYAQGRQGMGIYCSTYRSRADISYVLYNPENPIVSTRTSKYTYTDVLSPGCNAIVAIACYSGYNQEDSLVFNKTSLQRGLFRAMKLNKIASSITKNQDTSGDDKFMKPPPEKTIGIKNGQYEKLNDDGFIDEETPIVKGDIVFGKVTPISVLSGSDKIYRDSSEQYKENADAVIDSVYTKIKNQDGYETRKALIRSERTPEVGDKFCCFALGHEVLTDKGWVYIDKLTKTHKVASLIGNALNYTCPIDIQTFHCVNEPLYEIDTDMVKLRVTMNHRLWIKTDMASDYRIELAQNIIGNKVQYIKNVNNVYMKCNDSKYISIDRNFILPNVDNIVIDMKIFLTFLGIWITKGYIYDNNLALDISNDKQHIKDVLSNVCEIMDIKICKHITKENMDDVLLFTDKYLVDFCKPLYISDYNRHLPDFVWQLNHHESRWLIDGMVIGSGYISIDGRRRYETCSKQLADDFQRLCLHAHYSANISAINIPTNINSYNESTILRYNISVIEKHNNPIVNKTKKQDRIINYTGTVHCCTVSGDGVIYVRLNGCPIWCGNSRHGQKGTIGITLEGIDMPFTKHGIRPDIIMNPNAIPSRMTIGQLWECLLGKTGALNGMIMDGTPFEDYDIEAIKDTLEQMGYNREGTEYLYNGMTGTKMKHMIFIGPTYYQRLKHMAIDKIHSRARGPMTALTRQPTDGRARDGGLRLGEMERDALIAHGMAKFLKERLMECSDAYSTYVCGECGLFARREESRNNRDRPEPTDVYFCPICKNYNDIHKVMIPYAFKLMIQELMAMCIAPRIRVKKQIHE